VIGKNKITEIEVVGHSLEACCVARGLANDGNSVVFIQTGKLGWPADDMCDYISEYGYDVICDIGIVDDFLSLNNAQYAHVPYNKLQMTNDMNGIVSYPLNNTSFGSNDEIIQMRNRVTNLREFIKEINDAPNYINIYKKFFPKWLYESLIRRIGMNKWHLRQSKISKANFIKELALDHLGNADNGYIYYPKNGYESLCTKILDDPMITVVERDIKDVKKIIPVNNRGKGMIIMDNRVDYLCNYIFGNLSRIDLKFDKVSFSELRDYDEYQCIDIGTVLTPYKDYWSFSSGWQKASRVYSTERTMTSKEEYSIIQPLSANVKMLNDYRDLIDKYPGKKYIYPRSMTVLL
jgi:UDP-galactopyranose mutase